MNKTELIDQIAIGADISRSAAEKVLLSITSRIIEAVANEEVVQLIGLGSFSQSQRSARTGRNPITGEVLQIPAATHVKFRPGAAFKDAVNQRN